MDGRAVGLVCSLPFVAAIGVVSMVVGCGEVDAFGCRDSSACEGNRLCVQGACMSRERAKREYDGIIEFGGYDSESRCVAFENGRIDCWGRPECIRKVASRGPGTAGSIARERYLEPVSLEPVAEEAKPVQVSFGDGHACARLANGRVRCWGCGTFGQTGAPPGLSPSAHGYRSIAGIENAVDVEAGVISSCAVETSGALKCWGRSSVVARDPFHEAKPVAGIEDAVDVEKANGLTCVVRQSHPTACWQTETNPDATLEERQPAAASGLSNLRELGSAAARRELEGAVRPVCGILEEGALRCQAGPESSEFVEIETWDRVRSLDGEGHVVCAVGASGRVECLGNLYDGLGEDGKPSWETVDEPRRVPSPELSGVVSVDVGRSSRCVLRENDEVACWGDNAWAGFGSGESGEATEVGEFVSPEFQARTEFPYD